MRRSNPAHEKVNQEDSSKTSGMTVWLSPGGSSSVWEDSVLQFDTEFWDEAGMV